jgi:Protein of unknown function (DUF1553)/Protein of unknown function (DUF1549)
LRHHLQSLLNLPTKVDRMLLNTGAALIGLVFLVGMARGVGKPLPGPAERWAEKGTGGSPGFTRHIVPLLGKLGCNNRACHGSFQGQNGFRLSLFGFEPDLDRKELLEDGGSGPRTDLKTPEDSLVLRKPTRDGVSHRGGQRMKVGSWQYRMFRQWIADGARYDPGSEPRLLGLEMIPKEIVLRAPGARASLRIIGRFSDGSREDVTALTLFNSNDQAVAAVNEGGEVVAARSGGTAIVARYAGSVASAQILVPFPDNKTPFPPFAPYNRADELVLVRLRKLKLPPSGLCTDEVFLRRAHLDLIGTLPTADETRRFLADRDPGKRARLIDALLERAEYAQFWGMLFSDWTGNGPYPSFDPVKANWMWQLWLEDKLARNQPYDQLVHNIICATSLEGRSRKEYLEEVREVTHKNEGRGNFDDGTYARRKTLDLYYINVHHRDPSRTALQTANAFLGLRLECAQCHNHPFDRWTRKDYESFKSFFAFVRYCDPQTGEEGRAGKRSYGRESVEPGLSKRFSGHVRHYPPRLLGGAVVPVAEGKDPRKALWAWMRSADNPFFAPALVNRVWAHYFGRGIVHPADDFNQGNPPTNPALLDWLARDFIEHKFDLKHLHRTILNSRTYQLTWKPNGSNRLDDSCYSHVRLRRVDAEVLMDAIAQVTGVPDAYSWVPRGKGMRAVGQASPTSTHPLYRAGYAMKIFGRPDREKTCACERSNEPSVAQALYLINDREVQAKLTSPKGRLARLLREVSDDRALVEELYLSTLCRYPRADELKAHLEHVATAPTRADGMRDVLWALFNVREFVFNH